MSNFQMHILLIKQCITFILSILLEKMLERPFEMFLIAIT